MTLPQAVRVNGQFPFPATVKGSGPVLLAKANGVWTIGLTIVQLPGMPIGFNPAQNYLLVYDNVTGTFRQTTIAALFSATVFGQRIITAAGDVAVLPTDSIILLNKLIGAATNINLPTAASRNGLPLYVKDLKYDANTNNITLVPSGAETIDGFSGAAAAANGIAKIMTDGDKKVIYPLAAGGGWFLL